MLRFSTGLVNVMGGQKSIKEAFADGVIKIYEGAQPSDANNAASSGNLLVTLTLSGGAFTEGTPSTAQVDSITLGGATNADTYTVGINPTPTEYTTEAHSYTSDASATIGEICQGLVNVINRDSVFVRATWDGTSKIFITACFPGQAFTTTLDANPNTDMSLSSGDVANSRVNGLHFGTVAAGVISKESVGVWQGTAVKDGDAGWWRFQANPTDDDSLSTTLVRMDGSCGNTSNADMQMSNVSITSGQTVTVDTFTITLPRVRS